MVRVGWAMLTELAEARLGFTWGMMARTLAGARDVRLRGVFRRLRAGALALEAISRVVVA